MPAVLWLVAALAVVLALPAILRTFGYRPTPLLWGLVGVAVAAMLAVAGRQFYARTRVEPTRV